MVTRRSLLRTIPVGVAATALGSSYVRAAAAPVRRHVGQAGLPLRFTNKTGAYDNTSINFYIVGTDLATGNQVHVTPEGVMQPVSLSDNGPDGYADYSIPFAGGGDTTGVIPGDMSGRIYFSLGDKLKFKVNEGNALAYPAGWVESDPSFGVVHDCVEFTYKAGRIYCNTTMVDMFSVPMSIALTGEQSPSTGKLVDGGRANIFSALRDHPDFGSLVVDDTRVIAPGHGIEAGRFSATYFDGYVNDVWSAYQSKSLTVNANNRVFTGQVTGDQFVFDGGVKPFSKPSTTDVFFCAGALAAPNDGVTGPVAAVLGAALNRTTLLDSDVQPTTDPAAFYQAPKTHTYSKVMHDNSADGKAYGFPFDDVGGFASYIEDNATEMAVTLTPF
ncbi:MAG: beta-1,3-glucanase family protein [Actinomycetia bacterium]|nr:beta-1,3-glucanase family protein [Actinomycetes bacterium]